MLAMPAKDVSPAIARVRSGGRTDTFGSPPMHLLQNDDGGDDGDDDGDDDSDDDDDGDDDTCCFASAAVELVDVDVGSEAGAAASDLVVLGGRGD